MYIKDVRCPLTKTSINEYACYLISEAAEGNIPRNEMPCKQQYDIEKEICLNCKFNDID